MHCTMEKDDKQSAAFSAGPEIENGSDTVSSQVAELEEIKRDLESRHINMIAIAGMIVSSLISMLSSSELITKIGHGIVPELWHCHRYRGTCRRAPSLYHYGHSDSRCILYDGRNYCLHALHWRICSSCN